MQAVAAVYDRRRITNTFWINRATVIDRRYSLHAASGGELNPKRFKNSFACFMTRSPLLIMGTVIGIRIHNELGVRQMRRPGEGIDRRHDNFFPRD